METRPHSRPNRKTGQKHKHSPASQPDTSSQPPASHLAKLPQTRRLWIAVGLLAIPLVGIGVWAFLAQGKHPAPAAPPVQYGYEVVHTYSHDPKAFCQGLIYDDGTLYESTGGYGTSTLREVDLKTGKVQRSIQLDQRLFGEGITVVGDHIYMLTWRSGICYVLDKATFKHLRTLRYRGEGWGLTYDGKQLIMSNGSSTLYFRDPKTFQVTGKLRVRSNGRPVSDLYELEYIDGEIYANVFPGDSIIRISPTTGVVTGWINLRQLFPHRQSRRTQVLNGIAYDKKAKRLFVTGKNWPKLFEIKLKKK